MDESRAAQLGEIATEAGIERASFLNDAAGQFMKFLSDNAQRVKDIGGLVLIDDDPEYLSIEPDGTFRSRTRFQDDTGEWVTETETIESGAELIEIYNPADIYAAFADAARVEAGLPEQPTAAEDLLETAGIASEMGIEQELDDDDIVPAEAPRDRDDAARKLYDLALTFQERSQRTEARLLDQFQDVSEKLAEAIGSTKIIDDEDERIWFRADGTFEGEVLPAPDDDEDEDEVPEQAEWLPLSSAADLVQFYDPTDLFGDLADALAEEHPGIAPEIGNADEGDENGA
jgi:hypothetical protein